MEIAPGVHQLDTSRASNCFLIAGPEPVLIDTCVPRQGERIAAHLAELGLKLTDIRRIILTHDDVDHIGSAQELRRVGGMEVYLHEASVPYALGQRRRKPFPKALFGGIYARRMRYGPPQPTLPIEDGQMLGDIQVIFTPGHSPGHVCLLYNGVLFAGDAFLTGDTFKMSPRLLTYDMPTARDSVRKLLNYDFHTAVSGHGSKATNAKAKLQELASGLEA